LEAEFGDAASRVDESEFFTNPDIETLARLLDGGSNGPAPSVPAERPPYIALQREGRLTPFFCIPGADENPYYFRELAQCLGDERPFYVLRDPQPLQERGNYTVEQAAARYAGFLRQIQPHGPYLLGGHCFGGMLAFETARQLTAQGAEVNRVVMFEVPTPGYPKPLKQWRRYSALAADLLLGRRRLSRVDVSTHLRLLIGLARKRTNRIRQMARPFDAPSATVHPNLRAAGIYSPKPFPGRVTHFMTPDEPRRGEVLESPLLGWRDFVRGEFEVRYTPGPAADIFRYPHVREMAARLRAVLASETASNPL
jgi:thioesterase domain-containing protein